MAGNRGSPLVKPRPGLFDDGAHRLIPIPLVEIQCADATLRAWCVQFRFAMMMKTAKHTLHAISDHGSDLAHTIGSGTADLAKRVGSGTANLAKRIGPRRGVISLVVMAAAIGGSIVLVRYLRARKANGAVDIHEDDIVSGAKAPSARTGKSTPASAVTH